MTNFLFFFYLWGREATAQLGSAGNQKTNNQQPNGAESLHTKAADVNSGQEVRGFCAKRKYVTRSTGRKLCSDLG